jgi:hypothetical protein
MSGQQYYKTIDKLPIWNWFKLKETGDARYLLVLPDYEKLPKKVDKKIQVIADKLTDKFIERYGFNDRELAIMEKQRMITAEVLEMLIDDDESHLTAIEIYKHELASLLKKEAKAQTVFQQAAILTSYFKGLTVDVYNTSVAMFYALSDQMQNEIKHLERHG